MGRRCTICCFCPFKLSSPLPKVKHAMTSLVAHVTGTTNPPCFASSTRDLIYLETAASLPCSASTASFDLNLVGICILPSQNLLATIDSSSMVQMKSVQNPLSYRNGGYQNLHPSPLFPSWPESSLILKPLLNIPVSGPSNPNFSS